MRQQTCEECGRPFTPTLHRQRRCDAHELRGRDSRSPTTRAQDAEYDAERRRLLVPGAVCHWCSAPATTVDHLIAVAHGGGHAGNLVPACEPCNFRRQAREDWPTPRAQRGGNASGCNAAGAPPPLLPS